MTLDKLKQYAEIAQDKIEGLKEVTRVDIVGRLGPGDTDQCRYFQDAGGQSNF